MDCIYLDNGATTMKKPDCVVEAVSRALTTFGGPGRGVHQPGIDASMAVFAAREAIAKLIGENDASRIAITSNATESLNIAIQGLLQPGEHAITTAASHNSVLRPLYRKVDDGAFETIVSIAKDGTVDLDEFEDAFRPDTKLAVITHSSNLTGDIYDVREMTRIAHDKGALVVVDAAQTAGVLDIDVNEMGCDVLCMTGHKSLYGPQGTGAIWVRDGLELPPFKVGGSGMHSYDIHHPSYMPEVLEAGTHNAHGCAGLASGVNYVMGKGTSNIKAHIDECITRFEDGIKDIFELKFYGGKGKLGRCGISAINLGDYDSGEVADALFTNYGICTRAGAHCAPLMHESLGTVNQGIVRFSFCSFTTFEEVDIAVQALTELAG